MVADAFDTITVREASGPCTDDSAARIVLEQPLEGRLGIDTASAAKAGLLLPIFRHG